MKRQYGRELIATREMLFNLTMREVKGEYRRTALGQFWSIINPIALMIVYSLVFAFLLRADPPPGNPSGLDIYALWLMCGLLPWTYFARIVTGGLTSITSNGELIKKVYFPRLHLPLSVTLSVGITFSIEMMVLTVALWIVGGFPLPWLPLVLIAMVLLAMFGTGVALMLAILNVHFRDTQHFVNVLLPMWMFLTPILYPVTLIEDAAAEGGAWVETLFSLNPMLHFVNVFRALLYDNVWPSPVDWLASIIAASVVFVLGYLIFAKYERRLAELL